MQISYKQLASHLKKPLARIYLITGNEFFLQQEAARQIFTSAKAAGVNERKLFQDAEGLQQLGAGMETMSLFAEQTYYEIRLPTALKKADGERITEWCQSDSEDYLVVLAPQLDKPAQKTAWFKKLLAEINRLGAWVTIWPVKAEEFPAWLTEQAAEKNLTIDPDAIRALAERTEGNLLAANQTLDRLTLVHEPGERISAEMMLQYTADNARFGAYEMLDTCLSGDARKTVRMLISMKEQATAIAIFSAIVSTEIRKLAAMSWQIEQGDNTSVVFRKNGVWQSKQRIYAKALQRYPSQVWQSLLGRCLSLDKIIKGQQTGDAWLVLESLLLVMAGEKQFAKGIPASI